MRPIHQPPQMNLIGPTLTKHLVDVTAVVGTDYVGMQRIGDLHEVLVVGIPTSLVQLRLARLEQLMTKLGEFGVVHFDGHFLAGPQRRVIQPDQPRHDAKPRGVERVVQGAEQDAVAGPILGDDAAQGAFDIRPIASQKLVVGRHLMFAIRSQHDARLTVHGE